MKNIIKPSQITENVLCVIQSKDPVWLSNVPAVYPSCIGVTKEVPVKASHITLTWHSTQHLIWSYHGKI